MKFHPAFGGVTSFISSAKSAEANPASPNGFRVGLRRVDPPFLTNGLTAVV
jgi:hypothetical protein